MVLPVHSCSPWFLYFHDFLCSFSLSAIGLNVPNVHSASASASASTSASAGPVLPYPDPTSPLPAVQLPLPHSITLTTCCALSVPILVILSIPPFLLYAALSPLLFCFQRWLLVLGGGVVWSSLVLPGSSWDPLTYPASIDIPQVVVSYLPPPLFRQLFLFVS